jgi:hypothetical protein
MGVQTLRFCSYFVPMHQIILTHFLMISYARWQRLSKDLLALFSLAYSFRSHYGPGDYSASNRNEYHGYLVGGLKAGGA